MSITTAGDNLIHYEALGRGKPLIFLHGWIGSWRYWWPSMQALSMHYRTFALDLWGYGDSSKSPQHYSLDDYAQLVADFVDRLGIAEPAVLVGHGLGAAVALRYAGQYQECVSHIAAVSLPLDGRSLNYRSLQGDQATVVTRATDRAASFPELEVEARKADPLAFQAMIEELRNTDLAYELPPLTCPLLLVYGENDPITQPPPEVEQVLDTLRTDRAVVTLPSCMHFPMLEETAQFNRLILDFLHSGDDVRSLAPKEYWKRRTY